MPYQCRLEVQSLGAATGPAAAAFIAGLLAQTPRGAGGPAVRQNQRQPTAVVVTGLLTTAMLP